MAAGERKFSITKFSILPGVRAEVELDWYVEASDPKETDSKHASFEVDWATLWPALDQFEKDALVSIRSKMNGYVPSRVKYLSSASPE